jgi:hypothetical protein
MSEQVHVSPDSVKYRLIATRTTTPTTDSQVKAIRSETATVEVIISDSRVAALGSQFGHAAIVVNGTAYSRAPAGYDSKKSYEQYIAAQQSFRDSVGYILSVSPEEQTAIEAELKRRVEVTNRDPARNEYSLVANNCSSNVVDVLHLVGILAHDPRGFGIVSPTDVAVGLSHSKRVKEKRFYRKLGP